MKRTLTVFVLAVLIVAGSGCAMITKDQRDWVISKADRSSAFVALMDKGETTRAQEQAWVRSQDESWSLWRQKVNLGLAAPSWMAPDKTAPAAAAPTGTTAAPSTDSATAPVAQPAASTAPPHQ